MMNLASKSIEINGNLYFIDMMKFLKNVHIVLILKKQLFPIKILNQINFFVIVTYIYILIQFKVFIYSPCKFFILSIQNALLLIY